MKEKDIEDIFNYIFFYITLMGLIFLFLFLELNYLIIDDIKLIDFIKKYSLNICSFDFWFIFIIFLMLIFTDIFIAVGIINYFIKNKYMD